jgi:transcriptional regulator with AAA-type ATPase domain
MPPELVNLMGPMGGGVAGAVAYAVVKLIEIKAGLPKLQADLDAVRQLHAACDQNVRQLQAQVAQLMAQLAAHASALPPAPAPPKA